jgi:hypothetical protein
VRNNVPYDLAFQMDDMTSMAHAIVFAGFEGSEFDFETWAFKTRSA